MNRRKKKKKGQIKLGRFKILLSLIPIFAVFLNEHATRQAVNLSASSYYVLDSSSMQYLNYGAAVREASPSIFPQKPFFVLKTRRTRITEKTRLVLSFYFLFFIFVLKNTENPENTKVIEKEQFLENNKIVLFVFSKTVFDNNNFQKEEPNIP